MDTFSLSYLATILLEHDGVSFVRIQKENPDFGEITIGVDFEPIKNKDKWMVIHRAVHSIYVEPKSLTVNVMDAKKDPLSDIIGNYGAS